MNTSVTTAVRTVTLVTDQLNAEWKTLGEHPVPSRWSLPALAGCAVLADALDAITRARRDEPDTADTILVGLLALRADHADTLAGRLVLQALLGRAVNLARRAHRPGAPGPRGDLPQLAAAAVAALWHAIATYPVRRRPHKVSVNLCMDALSHFTAALDERVPEPVDIASLDTAQPLTSPSTPAVVEVLSTLTWGISTRVITSEEAELLVRVYCPRPGRQGGARAVAHELGLPPGTVRQRCSRATQRLAAAVRAHRTTRLRAA